MKHLIFAFALVISTVSFTQEKMNQEKEKKVVYQVFTRLFGNTNTTNKPWGTIEENGVGKFNDFTDKALQEIKDLGVTHIWYTGVPHHAVIRDYTKYGISNDDPDVVKGRAGSPYAIKDYYQVDPDMAVNPENRMQEFEDLIERTHKNGMKVIMDIVPNHVARKYEGKNNPVGVEDFGANDDKTVEYKRDNNFYYIPNESFQVPDLGDEKPLNGETNPLSDGKFNENPAKWTGNGSRSAKPNKDDWYETVKINYGVRPDGSKDFPELPKHFANLDYKAHFNFWKNQDVPDSWKKYRDICLFWLDKGVDGFRYDVAELVPYEFWSYLNSSIKIKNPDTFLVAEVYNPKEYRNYIHFGKMDYLYDKVGTYDTLREIIQGKASTDKIVTTHNSVMDIEHSMLHFLENHDEHRIATPEFAKTAEHGKPMMVVSTLISTSPTMIYFGQEVGEKAEEDAGYGKKYRTTIFDYFGVPAHQRWVNNGEFDGGQLSKEEKELREFYEKLLNFSIQNQTMLGEYQEIHTYNRESNNTYNDKLFSFVRWKDNSRVLVISNFDDKNTYDVDLEIPKELIEEMNLTDSKYKLNSILEKSCSKLKIKNGQGVVTVKLKPLQSYVYEF
ncbi:MAG: alpha-amylase family protein [Flavobacteriales bacterium]|nr:alpha-amylase family protein [Flavobacteriales bacterium]